jgi:hypothetical protein
MVEAKCEIIGVQEVYGKSTAEALSNLEKLGEHLGKERGRTFQAVVGEIEYDEIRTGFLIDRSVATVKSVSSPRERNLPKLTPFTRSSRPSRYPLGVVVRTIRSGSELALVSIHLKSKVMGFKDPTGTEFETVRMAQAEQARLFASELPAKTRLILGDRNSASGSATDLILQGALTLKDFSRCGLTRELTPLNCPVRREPDFRPLFAENTASILHKGVPELIDMIYLSGDSIRKIAAGVTGEFFKGSDHKLLWVKLETE